MLGFSDAQAVVCECSEAEFVDGDIGVRIVEVLEWQVPVRAVEANAVGQDLERL